MNKGIYRMEKESIRAIFNGNEEEIYQACAKFFYRHPECLTTLERQIGRAHV